MNTVTLFPYMTSSIQVHSPLLMDVFTSYVKKSRSVLIHTTAFSSMHNISVVWIQNHEVKFGSKTGERRHEFQDKSNS